MEAPESGAPGPLLEEERLVGVHLVGFFGMSQRGEDRGLGLLPPALEEQPHRALIFGDESQEGLAQLLR